MARLALQDVCQQKTPVFFTSAESDSDNFVGLRIVAYNDVSRCSR